MLSTGLNILAEGVSTVGIEHEIKFARWSSDNALLIGGVLTVAVLYAVTWMYRREARGQVSPKLRWSLVGCRAFVLLLLGMIGLEPILVNYIHRRLDAYTLVLVDESASMSLADSYRMDADAQRAEGAVGAIPADGLVRADVCESVMGQNNRRWLKSLADSNDVKVFSFGNAVDFRGLVHRESRERDESSNQASSDQDADAETDSVSDRSQAFEFTPKGSVTDLGLAIRAAVDSVTGAPIAGIILLTDGRFNRGESLNVIGRYLKQKRIGLYAIGVGDPAEPVNARVTQISAPRSVFKNDPFSVTVLIEADGVDDAELKVALLERRISGEGAVEKAETVEERMVRPDADGRVPAVVFERTVEKPGVIGYVARVSSMPYEAVTTDNQRELLPAVQVLDDKMKILLISGSPSYDYRFLSRMLERDATVDLSTWLQSADINAVRDGNSVIKELPTETEDINKYDAIILMDCDPKEFNPTWGSIIANYVSDHGGGLLYAAGNKYTGRFFRSTKLQSLIEMLPVVPDPEAEIVINELGHYQTRAWPIMVPEEAAASPILRQSDNISETRDIWTVLGKIFWHYPVRREKPVAQALMRHTNPRMVNTFGPHVLLATQFVGTGRTAYLGTNATWRWRRTGERYFNRFWIQMLRYLVEGKLLGGRARGQILTTKDHYDLGESVVMTVRALDQHYAPLLLPVLELTVNPTAGSVEETTNERETETVPLSPLPGRDGYYEGRFIPDRVGTLKLSAKMPGGTSDGELDETAVIEKEIFVSKPDIEMRNTAMDRTGLKTLVETAGGKSRYFEIDEFDAVTTLIEDRSRTSAHVGRIKPLWDNKYLFTLLIALLTIEWILRKKAKLL